MESNLSSTTTTESLNKCFLHLLCRLFFLRGGRITWDLWDFSSLTRDWTQGPQQWVCGVLTTRPPGNSQCRLFSTIEKCSCVDYKMIAKWDGVYCSKWSEKKTAYKITSALCFPKYQWLYVGELLRVICSCFSNSL